MINIYLLFNLDEEILCYVHDVVGVQKAGKRNYTTCKLQTSEQTIVKAICFSPEKVGPLKRAKENRSPVKVRRYEYNEISIMLSLKNQLQSTTTTNHYPSLQLNHSPLHWWTYLPSKQHQLISLF